MAPVGVSASAQDIFPESSSSSVRYKLSERYGTYANKKPTYGRMVSDSEVVLPDVKRVSTLTSLGGHKGMEDLSGLLHVLLEPPFVFQIELSHEF